VFLSGSQKSADYQKRKKRAENDTLHKMIVCFDRCHKTTTTQR